MVHSSAARHQIAMRLDELRQRSFAELTTLPRHLVERVQFGADEWSLTIYRDIEKEAVRIVVQIGPPQSKFLLLNVQAEGFRVTANGTITPLSQSELFEFM